MAEPCNCPSGKHCHLSLTAAQVHVQGMKERGVWTGQEAYGCGQCPHFHVGRPKKGAHKNKYKQE